jgi:hypothetical protein
MIRYRGERQVGFVFLAAAEDLLFSAIAWQSCVLRGKHATSAVNPRGGFNRAWKK